MIALLGARGVLQGISIGKGEASAMASRARQALKAATRLRALAALGAASGLGVALLAAPSIGVGATGPAIRTCSTSNLRVDKIGENDFTSHRGWIFALRNVGSRTCKLRGYPSVRLLGASAQNLPTTVDHFGGAPMTVTLTPWKRAYFATTFAVSGPCLPRPPVFAYGMAFTPPGASSRLVHYAGRFDLCGPPPARVSIAAVSATNHF